MMMMLQHVLARHTKDESCCRGVTPQPKGGARHAVQSGTDGVVYVDAGKSTLQLAAPERAQIRRHRSIGMPSDLTETFTSRVLCCVADFPQQHAVCPALLE